MTLACTVLAAPSIMAAEPVMDEDAPETEGPAAEASDAGVPAKSFETEPVKDPKKAKTPKMAAFLEGTRLPPRGTYINVALALGKVGSAGFSIGGRFTMGWRLGKLLGLALRVGGGSTEKRTGTRGMFVHGDLTLPIRLGLCSHVPRVCPGLDLYVAAIPGAGYAYFYGNHAINGILGVSIESVRTRGKLDVGVLAAGFIYIDFLRDRRAADGQDPWLAHYVLELGVVLRWGQSGHSSP